MPKSSAPACSAPTPALGAHPLKQSPQQPPSWHLLGACCIPRLQADRYFLHPKLAPSLCFPLRSKCLLHRLQGSNVYPFSSGRIGFARTRYTSSRHSFLPPLTNALLHHPQPPYCTALCRITSAEELRRVVAKKSLPLWCFPRREASFIRSVQRTAMSRPQPIRIRGKVREADSLPDTRVTYRFI